MMHPWPRLVHYALFMSRENLIVIQHETNNGRKDVLYLLLLKKLFVFE